MSFLRDVSIPPKPRYDMSTDYIHMQTDDFYRLTETSFEFRKEQKIDGEIVLQIESETRQVIGFSGKDVVDGHHGMFDQTIEVKIKHKARSLNSGSTSKFFVSTVKTSSVRHKRELKPITRS